MSIEQEIKITMSYYGCTRGEALEALSEGNCEALSDYEDQSRDYAERAFAASSDWEA